MVGPVNDSDLTVYYAPFHTQNNEWLIKKLTNRNLILETDSADLHFRVELSK